jgi:hypothetical protein
MTPLEAKIEAKHLEVDNSNFWVCHGCDTRRPVVHVAGEGQIAMSLCQDCLFELAKKLVR